MSRNRQRTKDPRSWRAGKSYKHETNRVLRRRAVEEPEALPHKKKASKESKKWCGGRIGREHIMHCQKIRLYGIMDRWDWTCQRCHKIVASWYPSFWMRPDLRPRPEWLPDDAPGGKRSM